MKDISIEKVLLDAESSFKIVSFKNKYFTAPLHTHPEYELILIESGTGLSFVGDSVKELKAGDLMLIGSDVPHLWLSDESYYDSKCEIESSSLYTQFNLNVFPDKMAILPEYKKLFNMFVKSQKGVVFKSNLKIISMFRELLSKSGMPKIIGFYSLLNELSESKYELLSKESYGQKEEQYEKDIILSRTIDYINQYYHSEITLESIAEHVKMNPSALCRYFKKHSGKKLFDYVCELRISYAVKLIINTNVSIAKIALECGYNNISHFNRQFKIIMSKTPTEYRKLMKK